MGGPGSGRKKGQKNTMTDFTNKTGIMGDKEKQIGRKGSNKNIGGPKNKKIKISKSAMKARIARYGAEAASKMSPYTGQ